VTWWENNSANFLLLFLVYSPRSGFVHAEKPVADKPTSPDLCSLIFLFLGSFLGVAKGLLRSHREEFEIRKSMSAVKAVAKKVQIEFTS